MSNGIGGGRGDLLSPAAVAKYARMDRHLIRDIRWRPESDNTFQARVMSYENNYIECDCGWEGSCEEFPEHRRTMLPDERKR